MKDRWPVTTLGSEVELLAGFAFKSKQYTDSAHGIRLLRGDNIVQGSLRWDDVKKWPADDTESYDRYRLADGDVVLAMDRPWVKAGLKHAMISEEDLPSLLVQRTARLRTGSNLDNRFLMYLIGSDDFTRHTLGVQTGIGVPHISGQQIKDFGFVRPPLSEQRRIVGILDEAFAGIATAKANAEQNLQNARALFESHLNAVFTQRGDGWGDTRLADICVRVSVGHVGPTSKFYCEAERGVPFLRSQNVRPGFVDLDGIRHITRAFHEKLKKSQLQSGDLLFVRVGANRGDCCYVPDGLGEINCANIVFARPMDGNAEYLARFCQSPVGRSLLLGMSVGSAQGVINTSSVAELVVPLPSNAEQQRLVEMFNSLEGETQRLESIYQRKIAALDELKKSLLHQAFSGQL